MSVAPYAVELATAGLAVVILAVDFLARHGRKALWACFLAGTAVLLALALLARGDGAILGGSYVSDGLSWFAKLLIIIGTGLTGALAMNTLRIMDKYQGAFAALLLTAALGMMVLVSSRELITMYVGLETSAISLYGLAALSKRDEFSLESGIKYLILGALSSGILLFGLSLIYATTGTTSLDAIRASVAGRTDLLFVTGLLFILLGVGFKLSMVPMHVWTPDVYQGAPTPAVAFISVVSKSAGFVFAIRLFLLTFADSQAAWGPFFLVAAVLTMTVGNLVAIPQKNVKRLLAYSTISQAGYLLVGFMGATGSALSSVMFYLLVYTFTNVAAFGVVIAFSHATGSDLLEDYAGLARREPVLALAFALALLSLAGIPPLGGFVGKVYLFYAAMQQGYLWLVIVAALNSIISLFYYLLVLKRMYISDPIKEYPKIRTPLAVRIVLLFTVVGIFWLGILPGTVMNVIGEISRGFFPGL